MHKKFHFSETRQKDSIPLKKYILKLNSFPYFCYNAHYTISNFTNRSIAWKNESLTVSNLREKQRLVMVAEYDSWSLVISKSLSCFFSCNALREIYHNKGLFALYFWKKTLHFHKKIFDKNSLLRCAYAV